MAQPPCMPLQVAHLEFHVAAPLQSLGIKCPLRCSLVQCSRRQPHRGVGQYGTASHVCSVCVCMCVWSTGLTWELQRCMRRPLQSVLYARTGTAYVHAQHTTSSITMRSSTPDPKPLISNISTIQTPLDHHASPKPEPHNAFPKTPNPDTLHPETPTPYTLKPWTQPTPVRSTLGSKMITHGVYDAWPCAVPRSAAVKWLGKFLRNSSGGVVIVSHDEGLLEDACDGIVEVGARVRMGVRGRACVCGGVQGQDPGPGAQPRWRHASDGLGADAGDDDISVHSL